MRTFTLRSMVLWLLALVLLHCGVAAWGQAGAARPKKVFAHYMGCWPAASGALLYGRQNLFTSLKADSADKTMRMGGHVRNYDLVPAGRALTAEQSADLEIRRALRIGIDGFAVDAWAGGDDARRSLDALFKVAEAKNYPFEITVCLDPCCGADLVGTVKELLAKHGTSPKLARRDGKPLIFGYMSSCYGMGPVMAKTDPKLSEGERKAAAEQLRLSPEGWEIIGQAYAQAQKEIGQPIFYHYCLTWFFLNIDKAKVKPGMLTEAAGIIAKHVGALGGFVWLGPEQDAIAKAAKAAGAEWAPPVGHYQKENIPYECYAPAGTEWMGCWDGARAGDATLLQIITWNDYGENTNIAPALNTRYNLYDLTGYHIAWWKTGKAPVPDHDQVYLNYRKHTKKAVITPFKACFGPRDFALEVITILPTPATIRLPGRDVTYDAPAGFFRKQVPLTAGPVIAELLRDGNTVIRLESPEPITDKPFREDHGLVCFSTEDARHWQADFGDTPPAWYSEYGDMDGDGLPNWWEMYYFGKWLDFATAGNAKPGDDPDDDGKTNLQEYQERTDPKFAPPPEEPE
jgi:hypothetical protein